MTSHDLHRLMKGKRNKKVFYSETMSVQVILLCFFQRIDMVPELLSSNLCSLRDDGDRYVLYFNH